MSFEARLTDDLIRILMAGGGLTINGSARMTDDLVRMAMAAANSGATLQISGMQARMSNDIIRIALAGKGRVHFI